MKKILLLSILLLVSIVGFAGVVNAANSIISVSPATVNKTVGTAFNVSIQAQPQDNKVCVVKGTLDFTNLTCQSITVASGVIAQTTPTCSSPSFVLGIPSCTTTDKNLITASVKGKVAGKASISVTGSKVIGVGVIVTSSVQGGDYNIIAATPKPATTPESTGEPTTTVEEDIAALQEAEANRAAEAADISEAVTTTINPNSLTAAIGDSITGMSSWIAILLLLLVAGYFIFEKVKKNKK